MVCYYVMAMVVEAFQLPFNLLSGIQQTISSKQFLNYCKEQWASGVD